MKAASEMKLSGKSSAFGLQSLLRWELLLAAVLVVVIILNASWSPYFLTTTTLSDASFSFTEKLLIALPMALLIIAGEIDISVAAIMALASVAMGLAAQAGWSTPGIVVIGLLTGAAAGALNGFLVTVARVRSIVATIGTMSLFRGIAYGVLGDRVLKSYPESFAFFGQGYVYGLLSFELVLAAVTAAGFGIYLRRTIHGTRLYSIGANPEVCRFSGVRVDRYRFWLFVATGVASGLAAILLTSRLGSTRPSLAQGWELDVISIVIFGGVAVTGGRGSILGVVLASVVLGLATFGLGLKNVPGIVMSIFVGTLLIGVVAIPELGKRLGWAKGSGRQ
jgi:rhamnose transport system permease protein